MNKAYFIVVTLSALVLSACASIASTPTPIPTIVLDNSSAPVNNEPGNPDGISASAVVVPIKDVQLAFAAVGRVTAVNVKVGDRVSANDVLVELDTTILEAKVKEAEANVLAADAQIRYLNRLGTDPLHYESAAADLERAQALLESAKATLLTQSTLTAPFSGTVVSLEISPAETVVPGQVVIVLSDLSRYQIETTDLSERDVTRVRIGQPVNIFVEALHEEFTGTVVDIERISSSLGGDVVFPVIIEFDRQPQGLLWGMSADVQIQNEE
jgi:RND family efflux transporter MFP subunit